jgi:hypothetical protein
VDETYYTINGNCVGIFPYIGMKHRPNKNGRYLQFFSVPEVAIDTIFRGMSIHFPAVLVVTRVWI